MRARADRAVAALVMVLALLMGLQFVVQSRHDRAEVACRAQFTNALRQSLAVRASLSDASDSNQNTLILKVTSLVTAGDGPPATAAAAKRQNEKYRQGFLDFAKRAGELEAKRKNSPIPELPDC